MAASTSSSCWAGLKLHGDGFGNGSSLRFRSLDCRPIPSRVELQRIQRPTVKAAMMASAPAGENTRRFPSLRLEKTKGKTMQEVEQSRRRSGRTRDSIVTPEKLEQWLSNSIGEIVRNMGEAPFLVNIFSEGEGYGEEEERGCGRRGVKCGMMSLETHKASPEDWTKIKMRWEEENRRPDAVILVEELNPSPQDDDEDDYDPAHLSLSLPPAEGGGEGGHRRRHHGHRRRSGAASSSSSSRKTLGLLVQGGGGVGCAAASCYILDTTRVGSSFGFCTHFCLTPARLGEPLDVQLKKTWLV